MYKIIYISPVKKDLQLIPKTVKKLIDNKYFPLIADNPFVGKFLKGEFKEYLSYYFTCDNVQYRIIYQIFTNKLLVLVIMIGSRENIYKRLKRRVD